MIAIGLTVELVAAVLLVVGLLLGASGGGVLWGSTALVLVGLAIAMIGVRRARPPRSAWLAAPAERTGGGSG